MTPLERSDLHAAIETRYPNNTTELITPELLRDGLHDLVESLFVKGTDLTPTGAVYLRLRNGKTLFHLGKGVRDKAKLRLRKFGGGTLPAILPAPVLDPNRPMGIGAPGTAFSLHPSIGGPATGPAAIAEYTRQVSDGGQFLLTGADLDQAKYPVYQGGNFYATTVTGQHSQRASVRLPRVGAAWDATLTWASTGAGISEPVLLNTAVLLWGQEQTVAGLTFSIYGRNLAHGNVAGGASYLAMQPVGGGPVRLLTGTATDAYNADFVTPNLALGDYYYWPHNGHGGDFGWGERGMLSVVAADNHVKTRDFGPATYVKLDKFDAAGNVATINAAFVQYRHFCTDDDTFPINAQLYPQDKSKWSCVSPTGRTVLRATSWDPKSQYLGMFGSNSWYMGMLERISFLDPDDVVPYKTKPGFSNQSLIDLRRATGSAGNEHIWLKDVEATWMRPYYEINMGNYSIPEEAQCLHVEGARHFFLDNPRIIGSGSHFGNCGQVFIENYWHRLRNGADHTLYGLHVNGFSIKGFDFQDHNPTSGDGVTRGAGRGPKFGGQGGSNQNTYLRDLNGRLLGPLFTGINPYFDRNQGEMCLYEGNRVVWQNMVVSATATTITFAGPVLSDPAAVAGGARPDDPAVGVLPDYHLLWIGRGRGIDQVRGIKSVSGNTITLDKPLRVVPDATSFVQTGTFTRGNTLVKVRLTGKRSIVDDIDFGIQCAINFYGGMFDSIGDDFEVTDTRHGFIFTPTVHANGQIDTVAFCQMLNSKFQGQRWVERYESYGKEEELLWSFGCSGLRNILVANIEATNWLEARVVFKVVREAVELATYWRPDAPPIDGLVRDGMLPVTNYLNDYRTPAGPTKYPPISPVAGVVEGFVQAAVQVQVLPTAPGVQLVAGDELGPLEPLPIGAAIDPTNGVLSYLGNDPAVLVYVDGAQEIPLDRTPVASTTLVAPTAPTVDAYTKTQTDSLLAAKEPTLTAQALLALIDTAASNVTVAIQNGKLVLTATGGAVVRPANLHWFPVGDSITRDTNTNSTTGYTVGTGTGYVDKTYVRLGSPPRLTVHNYGFAGKSAPWFVANQLHALLADIRAVLAADPTAIIVVSVGFVGGNGLTAQFNPHTPAVEYDGVVAITQQVKAVSQQVKTSWLPYLNRKDANATATQNADRVAMNDLLAIGYSSQADSYMSPSEQQRIYRAEAPDETSIMPDEVHLSGSGLNNGGGGAGILAEGVANSLAPLLGLPALSNPAYRMQLDYVDKWSSKAPVLMSVGPGGATTQKVGGAVATWDAETPYEGQIDAPSSNANPSIFNLRELGFGGSSRIQVIGFISPAAYNTKAVKFEEVTYGVFTSENAYQRLVNGAGIGSGNAMSAGDTLAFWFFPDRIELRKNGNPTPVDTYANPVYPLVPLACLAYTGTIISGCSLSGGNLSPSGL